MKLVKWESYQTVKKLSNKKILNPLNRLCNNPNKTNLNSNNNSSLMEITKISKTEILDSTITITTIIWEEIGIFRDKIITRILTTTDNKTLEIIRITDLEITIIIISTTIITDSLETSTIIAIIKDSSNIMINKTNNKARTLTKDKIKTKFKIKNKVHSLLICYNLINNNNSNNNNNNPNLTINSNSNNTNLNNNQNNSNNNSKISNIKCNKITATNRTWI